MRSRPAAVASAAPSPSPQQNTPMRTPVASIVRFCVPELLPHALHAKNVTREEEAEVWAAEACQVGTGRADEGFTPLCRRHTIPPATVLLSVAPLTASGSSSRT